MTESFRKNRGGFVRRYVAEQLSGFPAKRELVRMDLGAPRDAMWPPRIGTTKRRLPLPPQAARDATMTTVLLRIAFHLACPRIKISFPHEPRCGGLSTDSLRLGRNFFE